MAEYCLKCWNEMNETHSPAIKFIFSEEPEICEGCGEFKKVILFYRLDYYLYKFRYLLFPFKIIFYILYFVWRLLNVPYVIYIFKKQEREKREKNTPHTPD